MSESDSQKRVTQRSLFFWAVQGNLKMQLLLLLLIVGMVFFRVVPLEMQKRIVNDAISLGKFDSLLLYCGIYILAVTATAAIKLAANYLQAVIGERAMLAMRKDLYAHIIQLPLHFFRNTQPGMVVSALMTELSTAGNFAGMALAVPISNILTLLAFAGYLLWLNPQLALATLGIYPVVAFLIPYLQKKANHLNKKRVDQSRLLSSQVAESITGVTEINVHGAYDQEKRKFNVFAERLRDIRTKWSLLRFAIKTVNNYFASLGPFVVFLFGGYLVMQGELELGSLVAFLSAQEKLYDPWKELIEYYQVYQDASVRYYRTMQYFDIAKGHEELPGLEPVGLPEGSIDVANLGYVTCKGVTLLRAVSFSLHGGETMALIGFSGSGKSTLIHCIAKMFDYSSGSIRLDGHEVKTMGKREIIRNVGYIAQQPFIFSGTIRENLLYAHEAALADGNPAEYEEPELDSLIFALQQAGMFVDVIRFGLNTVLDHDDTGMMEKIVRIREQFQTHFGEELEQYIEFYNEDDYLQHCSVAENIIFGTALDRQHLLPSLGANLRFRSFLDSAGLTKPLLVLGTELLETVVTQSESEELARAFTVVVTTPEQLSEYRTFLVHLGEDDVSSLTSDEKSSLLTLALQYIPGSYEITEISQEMKRKVLQARREWSSWSKQNFSGFFSHFAKDRYINGQSILNNILFGNLKRVDDYAQELVNQNIIRLLIEEDCLESIAEAGMEYQLGSMGNLLSGGQKQKLSIARVLLKNPKIILMDESTSALDNKSQARIQNLIERRWRKSRTVIAVVHRLDGIEGYDRIGVMKDGQLAEFGTYAELVEQKGLFCELVFGS